LTHAFLYADGAMVDLGTFGGTSSAGRAINSSSAVAGSAQTADGAFHAFVHIRGELIDLGTFGGRHSEAGDMNDVGQITGYADTADGQTHAFLATPIAHLFSRLVGDATGIGPGKSLVNTVKAANESFEADDLRATCAALDRFISKLRKFSGMRKPLVEPALAEGLIEDALAIMTAIRCH
jgi:probable HAF family extracellular repeat protein